MPLALQLGDESVPPLVLVTTHVLDAQAGAASRHTKAAKTSAARQPDRSALLNRAGEKRIMLEATVRNEGRQTVEVAVRAVFDMGTHLNSLFHEDHFRMFEQKGGTRTHPVHRLRIPERNQGPKKE